MIGSRTGLLGPALLLVSLAGGCNDRPSWARERLGRAYFDSAGAYVHAGISTRIHPRLEPLDLPNLHGDTLGRPFQLFRMRCAACHRVPDPSMKSDQHWPYLVGKMKERTKSAGLVPMTDAEADTILRFLKEHSRR